MACSPNDCTARSCNSPNPRHLWILPQERSDLGDGVMGNGLWADTVVLAKVKSSSWSSAKDKKTDSCIADSEANTFMLFARCFHVSHQVHCCSEKGKILLYVRPGILKLCLITYCLYKLHHYMLRRVLMCVYNMIWQELLECNPYGNLRVVWNGSNTKWSMVCGLSFHKRFLKTIEIALSFFPIWISPEIWIYARGLHRSLTLLICIVRLVSKEYGETGKWKLDEKGRLLKLLPFVPDTEVPGGLRQSEVIENCVWLFSLVPLIRIRFPFQKLRGN